MDAPAAFELRAPKSVLVVDDEPTVRETLVRFLESAGFQVRTAENGQEALDRMAESLPDLLVLDLGLPGMDGIEVLGAMQNAGWQLPTVMLSGLGDLDLAKLALRLGASIYLTKPVEMAELQRTARWYTGAANSPRA